MPSSKKNRVVMARLVPYKKQSDDFDLEFWQKVPASRRLEAAWDMILELSSWKKNYARQQRLRRSAEVLKHR